MVQGINIAASGMISVLNQNDIIANNLANINTPGFKQLMPTFKNIHDSKIYDATNKNDSPEENVIGSISAGSAIDASMLDFKQGAISKTNSPLDVAINGKGFFCIESDGKECYSRNGRFSLNEEGELVTSAGNKVLGENGRSISIDVQMGGINDVVIAADGRILQKGAEVDRLKMVDFEDKSKLQMMGNSLFSSGGEKPVELENVALSQGYIEGSNANVIESMINSITGARTYETLSSVIKNSNATLKQTVTQVGAVQ